MPPNPPTEDRTWKPIRPWRSRVQPISGSDVPEVPPVGGVVAANLADGRPVFVVYHEDGTLSVVDAFSTHVTYGIGKLVGWCSSSRTFEDPFHGSKWDEFGDYELGPAPTGLVTYQSFGGQGDQNQVRVDGVIPPHPRGFQTQPFQPAGPFVSRPRRWCCRASFKTPRARRPTWSLPPPRGGSACWASYL